MSASAGSSQKYTLGLDLGSASLGWALVALDDSDEPIGLRRARERRARCHPHRSHPPRLSHEDNPALAASWPCATSARWSRPFDNSPAPTSAAGRVRRLHASVGHVPGRCKPFLKRNSAAVEDGSCRNRYFAAAVRASPAPVCRPPALFLLTRWTANPGWPPQPLQIRGTGRLIGKPEMKLLPCSRIGRVNFRSWRISHHCI